MIKDNIYINHLKCLLFLVTVGEIICTYYQKYKIKQMPTKKHFITCKKEEIFIIFPIKQNGPDYKLLLDQIHLLRSHIKSEKVKS